MGYEILGADGEVLKYIDGPEHIAQLNVPDGGSFRPADFQEGDPSDPMPGVMERHRRDTLLAQSDWTQVADAPVDAGAWAAYRQALRDLPGQPGFPETINWPVRPDET